MDKDKINNTSHLIYLYIIGGVFIIFTVIFLCFPRTKYSELEKREMAEFPAINGFEGSPSEYTAAISQWFSDSEPFRDHFMTLSMNIRDKMKFNFRPDEEAVSFRQNVATVDPTADMEEQLVDQGNPLLNEKAKIANSGIIVVGSGPNVRALSAFGAREEGGKPYLSAIDAYAEAFPNVNIYSAVIPTAAEFYLPEKAKNNSRPQKPVIDYIHANNNPRIKDVDIRAHLAAHTTENIYLRTDHHWAPLGAFYAAKAMAKAAGVPFKELDAYDKMTVHDFVGTMYGYTNDIAVKNAPEDFIYYIPNSVDYTTSIISYNLNSNYQVTGQSGPTEGIFFRPVKDCSNGAYSTFMGGDRFLVKVKTNTPGNRKALIIKDSFGNALPGYLFYSFNEVHVVDFRYFSYNIKNYVKENGITDIYLAFNSFNACSSSAMDKVKNFLTQRDGTYSANKVGASSKKEDKAKKESPKNESTKKDSQNKEANSAKETAPKEKGTETPSP